MKANRYEISAGVIVDSHRAVWIQETGTLAIADLHLGYAWAHRHAGHLVPLVRHDNLIGRVGSLLDDYPQVQQMILLGDIVHKAIPIDAIRCELTELFEMVGSRTSLRLILGNHDRRLPQLLKHWSITVPLSLSHYDGGITFVHGDLSTDGLPEFVVMGHEHPVIALGDGIAARAFCPCFLSSPSLLVLPAFTRWSAGGGDIRSGRFLSPLAAQTQFDTAVAILGDRLLPMTVRGRITQRKR